MNIGRTAAVPMDTSRTSAIPMDTSRTSAIPMDTSPMDADQSGADPMGSGHLGSRQVCSDRAGRRRTGSTLRAGLQGGVSVRQTQAAERERNDGAGPETGGDPHEQPPSNEKVRRPVPYSEPLDLTPQIWTFCRKLTRHLLQRWTPRHRRDAVPDLNELIDPQRVHSPGQVH
jgi:hypothetical protein